MTLLKFSTFLVLVLFGIDAQGSEPINVHIYKTSISGSLPEPYKTIKTELEVDRETNNIILFTIARGSENIPIPNEIISQLKNVHLNTLSVSHEMHRSKDKPAESRWGLKGDWLIFDMEIGDRYKAVRIDKGKTFIQWGRDLIRVTINKGNSITTKIYKVAELGGYWYELPE